MMSEVFFIYLAQPETARKLLWAAQAVAANVGPVRFEVMVVLIPPEATIMPTEQVLSREDCERIRREESERAARLRRIYDQWAGAIATGGHHSEWIEIEGLAAKEMAQQQTDKAVTAALSPICVDKFRHAKNADENLGKLKAISYSWEKGTYVSAGGWATMPGQTSADRRAVEGCTGALVS